MKLAAIICEYNPLHNGHLHQMQQTKLMTGADGILCIMSGNFTQRAESTIIDKYARAKIAILCGADIVVGLPTPYSTNNAEVFGLAAVKIANSFKNVKWLSFGMEEPNLNLLDELANFFVKEADDYKLILKEFLKSGLSFNESRIKAVESFINNKKISFSDNKKALELLTMPNNILALEYVKSLKQISSNILPVAIKRVGSNYTDKQLQNTYSSATAIRKTIFENFDLKKASLSLPKYSYIELKNYITKNGLINAQKLNELVLYKMRTTDKQQLKQLYNMGEGLENRLKSVALSTQNAKEFIEEIQTRRYKNSRINSILLNAVLNINKSVVIKIYKVQKLPFIKVLAINTSNKQLLSELKCSSKLILRKNDIKSLKQTTFTKELIEAENNANAVYNLLIGKNVIKANDIYTTLQKINQKSE
ncbi:MAG: nucleotidyltransferase family protein [Clostridia bacterium]|nr:nucleotidyltransferase family protein [Clostridia bacterium]